MAYEKSMRLQPLKHLNTLRQGSPISVHLFIYN